MKRGTRMRVALLLLLMALAALSVALLSLRGTGSARYMDDPVLHFWR